MAYDFSGLTTAQQWLLTMQGWDQRFQIPIVPRPRKTTWQPLVERGLAVMHPKGVGRSDIRAIEIPIAVHMAWCAHCSTTQEGA